MNPQTAAPFLADANKFARIVDALDKCSVRLNELRKVRYENVRHASIRDGVPNIRCEEARTVECIREAASAAKLGQSAYEENVPHRNELPPREEMPYHRPGPTIAEILALQLSDRSKPKQLADAPSNVAQQKPPGNQTETHGNPR